MYVWSPVSSRFDFVFFGHHVSEADFLCPVETEVGLFVDLGGPVGVRGHGAVFHSESFGGRFGEGARGGRESSEVGEGWMSGWEERHGEVWAACANWLWWQYLCRALDVRCVSSIN